MYKFPKPTQSRSFYADISHNFIATLRAIVRHFSCRNNCLGCLPYMSVSYQYISCVLFEFIAISVSVSFRSESNSYISVVHFITLLGNFSTCAGPGWYSPKTIGLTTGVLNGWGAVPAPLTI